jgi:hypothetical protein
MSAASRPEVPPLPGVFDLAYRVDMVRCNSATLRETSELLRCASALLRYRAQWLHDRVHPPDA